MSRRNESDDDSDEALRALRDSILRTPRESTGAPPWILTFADLMSLMLTFFVVLLSFARIDSPEARGFTRAVGAELGVQVTRPGAAVVTGDASTSAAEAKVAVQPASTVTGVRQLVARYGGRTVGGTVDLEVFESYRGVTLSIASTGLFERGEAGVLPAAWGLMDDIADLAVNQGGAVEMWIHGEIDGDAAAAELLSVRRAAGLSRYMMGAHPELDATRLSVRASGGFRPSRPSASATHAAANRRVEFTFLSESTALQEGAEP
jgi:chemotaxis protein MotB